MYMKNKVDVKLYFSLILWTLIPSVYLTVRMYIVSINKVDINILGQMEWFDLIDEVITTMLVVPLYSLLNKTDDQKNRKGLAFIISILIYGLFTIFIASHISHITKFMLAEYATEYLLLQSVSLFFSFVLTLTILLFTINDDYKMIWSLLVAKVVLLSICDYIFIATFKDIGASYSEILVNSLLAIFAIILLIRNGYIGFKGIDRTFINQWFKIGSFAGIQIFLDNFIYAIMIVKMVNAVNESGNYWVANNFIWGWLLVPVMCFAELIKKNDLLLISFKNTWKYALMIVLLWIATMPFWNTFIKKAMAVNPSSIMCIVMLNIPFYLTYIVSAFIDAWFISKGKTLYNMVISLMVNIVYYGIVYILFNKNVFAMNMQFIIYMFGVGMVIHMLLSIILYIIDRKVFKTEVS